MKLLNKTNFYFLGVSLIIFCVGGILFYLLFQIILDNDINNKLHQRKEYNLKQLTKSDSIMLFQKYSANMLNIRAISRMGDEKERISDTLIFDEIEGKAINYRQLSFNVRIHNQKYNLQIRRALVEQKDLVEGVALLVVFLFLAFVVILTLINNQVSRKIWEPFYTIVDKIRNYKVDLAQPMILPKTSIDEFEELSVAIEKMTDKINHEFNVQREFTENTSHEIQTPLAIATNKLELLLQSPGLSGEQMELIHSASIALTRLSKLNEALVILSKIENRQFHEVEDVCINDMIDQQLGALMELIQIKSISVKKNYRDRIHTKMHPYLAEILLENLIINSIKHNTTPGTILVSTDNGRLNLVNSGRAYGQPDKFFQRFVKSNSQSQSLGLGLSIVKAICDTYLTPIQYRIEGGYHKMTVFFGQGNMSPGA